MILVSGRGRTATSAPKRCPIVADQDTPDCSGFFQAVAGWALGGDTGVGHRVLSRQARGSEPALVMAAMASSSSRPLRVPFLARTWGSTARMANWASSGWDFACCRKLVLAMSGPIVGEDKVDIVTMIASALKAKLFRLAGSDSANKRQTICYRDSWLFSVSCSLKLRHSSHLALSTLAQ